MELVLGKTTESHFSSQSTQFDDSKPRLSEAGGGGVRMDGVLRF